MAQRSRFWVGAIAAASMMTMAGGAQAQGLLGAVVGNGVTPGTALVTLGNPGQSAVAIGALSGNSDHYGSLLSLSLLNSNRLLGVDGPAGAYTGLSVFNPSGAPVLAPHH